MGKPILCLDFDGVIHSYTSGWQGIDFVVDPPVPGAFDFILRAKDHFDVVIYSSRSKEERGIRAMKLWLRRWAVETGLYSDLTEVVRFVHEKPSAFLTIDDRAIQFDGNWGALDPAVLKTFQPWNKR
jgi:hypothetical protein